MSVYFGGKTGAAITSSRDTEITLFNAWRAFLHLVGDPDRVPFRQKWIWASICITAFRNIICTMSLCTMSYYVLSM